MPHFVLYICMIAWGGIKTINYSIKISAEKLIVHQPPIIFLNV